MPDQEKTGVVVPFKATAKHPIRKPFVPLTGNPENGDYEDWYRHLCENSDLITFPPEKKPVQT